VLLDQVEITVLETFLDVGYRRYIPPCYSNVLWIP